MERGVIVGGILISTSFLLAVMLNRSAMDAAPVRSVNAETRGPAARIAPRALVANPPIASQSLVRDVEAASEPSEDAGGESRRDDCSEKTTMHSATSQRHSSDCSS